VPDDPPATDSATPSGTTGPTGVEQAGVEQAGVEQAGQRRELTPFGPDGHPRRWAILGVLVVSLLIVVLDNTVLNIALPTIQRDLGASQSQLVWAVDSYILAFAALLFTWGVLGDRFGRKRILTTGLAVFAIGSALSSIATDPAQLIGFRALMGVGGAAVMPVTLAIITVVFPPEERGRAIGTWAGAVGGAIALGPVLGGLLLENPQWFRWLIGNDWGSVFLINVPIIAVGMVGILRVVPETRNPHPQQLDFGGLALSVTGLLSLVYGIIHAGDTRDWLSPSVLLPIAVGLVVLGVFGVTEWRSAHRSFDVTLFANRSYAISLTAVSLVFFAMSGVTFTLPFYLQVLRGYSTLDAGLCFLPFAAGQLLSAPRSARMVTRFGERAVMATGLTIVLVTLILLSRIHITTPLWQLLVLFFVYGLGMGNVIAPGSTVMQNALPLARAGAGSAVQNTVRQVAGALGVAIVGTVLITRYGTGLGPTLAKLPPSFPEAGRQALTASVAGVPVIVRRAAQAGAPSDMVDAMRDGAFAAYLAAAKAATMISVAMVLVADAAILLVLPKRVGHH
jgi:DHA2 family multidrug resistance protein-like MFS transporter